MILTKGNLKFELHASVIIFQQRGNVSAPNKKRLLEKIGLRYVKDARFYNSDVKYYTMTREDYERDDSTYIQRSAED